MTIPLGQAFLLSIQLLQHHSYRQYLHYNFLRGLWKEEQIELQYYGITVSTLDYIIGFKY